MLLDKLNEDLKTALKGGDSFKTGVIRMVLASVKNKEIEKKGKGVLRSQPKVFLIHLGDEAKKKGLGLIQKLVEEGISIGESFGRESLKSQLRMADKEKALLALIIGQKEVFEESVIVRDMSSGVQETIPLTKIVEDIKKRI